MGRSPVHPAVPVEVQAVSVSRRPLSLGPGVLQHVLVAASSVRSPRLRTTQNSPAGEPEDEEAAEHARDPTAQPRVLDARGRVVRQRAVGRRRVVRAVEEAGLARPRTPARPGGSSRSSSRRRRSAARRSGRRRRTCGCSRRASQSGDGLTDLEPSRRAARVGRRTRGRGVRRPPTPTTSPVITASPIPITVCQDTIAVSTVSMATGAVPPIANSEREGERSHRHAHQCTDSSRRRDHGSEPLREQGADERRRRATPPPRRPGPSA